MEDVDLVLTEGFKREPKPKVEVLANKDNELISPREDLFLVAADHEPPVDVPIVKRDDVKAIADIIEEKFLQQPEKEPGVQLSAGGKEIPLNPIMKAMVMSTISGLIASLRGVDNPDDVEIKLFNQRNIEE